MTPRLEEQPPSSDRLAAAATLAGLSLSIVFAVLSDGSLQDDGLAHYLYARWAWHDLHALFDAWGRPGMTLLYAVPARLGWTACRIASALLSAASAWLAYLTARRLHLERRALAPILVLAQPLFLALSWDTFTETTVAFYLALATWLLVEGRTTLSSLAISLCFVTRYETLVLALPWCVGFRWFGAKPVAYAALAWAPAAYSLAGRMALGVWPIEVLRAAPHLSEYGAGTLLSMTVKSLVACGPAIGVLALVGCVAEILRGFNFNADKHGSADADPCHAAGSRPSIGSAKPSQVLALAYLTHLLAQSSIYWLGAFSSGGYARFFVSTAPLAGILALHGLDALLRPEFRRAWAALLFIVLIALVGVELEPPPRDEVWLLVYRTTRPLVRGVCLVVITATAAGLAASRSGRVRKWARGVLAFSALGSMIGPWAYLVRPHAMTEEASDIGAAVAWLRSRRLDSGQIITTHVWTSYFLDSERNITALPGEDPLADAGPGDVLIWDARYSPSERFRLTQKRIEADKRWRRLWSGPERDLSRRGLNRETPRAPFALIYRLESP